MKKNFISILEQLNSPIVCLQETKLQEYQAPKEAIPYPYQYYHSAEKKGYSGTAILSHINPIAVSTDFPSLMPHPQEGRVQAAEFDSFYLVNVYVPNSQDGLRRLDYRTQQFDPDFRNYLSQLQESKPIIVCGDFNVAHQEIDIARPKANHMNAGFTDKERKQFGHHLDNGLIDTFRHLHPNEPDNYTWWSYRGGARAKNIGWRIDYFLISNELESNLTNAQIHADATGSDHCPIEIVLNEA